MSVDLATEASDISIAKSWTHQRWTTQEPPRGLKTLTRLTQMTTLRQLHEVHSLQSKDYEAHRTSGLTWTWHWWSLTTLVAPSRSSLKTQKCTLKCSRESWTRQQSITRASLLRGNRKDSQNLIRGAGRYLTWDEHFTTEQQTLQMAGAADWMQVLTSRVGQLCQRSLQKSVRWLKFTDQVKTSTSHRVAIWCRTPISM